MNQLIPLIAGILSLAIGSILGYYARQSIAKRNYRTIEARLQKKISQARQESDSLIFQAKERAAQILETAKKEESERRGEILKTERLLLKRENILEEKSVNLEEKEKEFHQKEDRLREIKES